MRLTRVETFLGGGAWCTRLLRPAISWSRRSWGRTSPREMVRELPFRPLTGCGRTEAIGR